MKNLGDKFEKKVLPICTFSLLPPLLLLLLLTTAFSSSAHAHSRCRILETLGKFAADRNSEEDRRREDVQDIRGPVVRKSDGTLERDTIINRGPDEVYESLAHLKRQNLLREERMTGLFNEPVAYPNERRVRVTDRATGGKFATIDFGVREVPGHPNESVLVDQVTHAANRKVGQLHYKLTRPVDAVEDDLKRR